jgi:N-methylhydantoinase B
MVDAISLEVFKNLFSSIAEEMGTALQRTAYSPNIKERRDFSCAIFDDQGRMIAQAAHIPVHLGAMPLAVAKAREVCTFGAGDIVVLNDPYLGGTHLPDITMVSRCPHAPGFFIASRAHHADVGGMSPGSMPLATEVYQEGLIIPPIKLVAGGRINQAVLDLICRNVRTPDERRGDLSAQIAAQRLGERRVAETAARHTAALVVEHAGALLAYSERMMREAIRAIPDGVYGYEDWLDDDGQAGKPVRIAVKVTIAGDQAVVDFTGSDAESAGGLNAVYAVTCSAVYYVFKCLAGEDVPPNHGCYAPIEIIAPSGTIVNPRPPHAVAGGNVETSQRIVDCLLGALAAALPGRIPAASQGTMNNLTVGGADPRRNRSYAYYETIGGGMGAGPDSDGLSGVHVHMSNTLNTPVEALELHYPFRITRYALRRGSGGAGRQRGGDGLVRSIMFLAPATVTLLSERRVFIPYGLAGGEPGEAGRQHLGNATRRELPGKVTLNVKAGDALTIETPGGGGWGHENERERSDR